MDVPVNSYVWSNGAAQIHFVMIFFSLIIRLRGIFSPMQNKPNTYTRFVMCLEDHHIQRDRQTPGTYIWWSLKQSHWRLLVQCTMMVNEWPLINNSLNLVLQTICVLSTPLFPYVKNLHIWPKIILHIRIF